MSKKFTPVRIRHLGNTISSLSSHLWQVYVFSLFMPLSHYDDGPHRLGLGPGIYQGIFLSLCLFIYIVFIFILYTYFLILKSFKINPIYLPTWLVTWATSISLFLLTLMVVLYLFSHYTSFSF